MGRKSCVETLDDKHVLIRKAGVASAYLKSQTNDAVTEFAFDHVFHPSSSQAEVYQQTIQPYLNRILEGQHVTVFAYGATGAGKTHTMFGSDFTSEHNAGSQLRGLIPHTIEDIFLKIHEQRQQSVLGEAWGLSFSFFEVYNDQVFDLLDSSSNKNLPLREDADKGVVQIVGLTEYSIESSQQMMELLHKGQKCRKMEPTMANVVSSRSHAIIQISLRHVTRTSAGFEKLVESKLSLIDLAGSERASATNNRGARLQEGANINKSLLALANCINALSEMHQAAGSNKKANNAVIKYRDSKLTHLLKSSLEGNCNLVMIANVNPCDTSYEDSLHSLIYANRAKNIKVSPMVKERILESTSLEREARLKEENTTLRKKIAVMEQEMMKLREHQTELELSLQAALDNNQKKGRKSSFFSSMAGTKKDRRSSMAPPAISSIAEHPENSPNKSPKQSLSSSPTPSRRSQLQELPSTSSPLAPSLASDGEEAVDAIETEAVDVNFDIDHDIHDNENMNVNQDEEHTDVTEKHHLPEKINNADHKANKGKRKRGIWTMFGCGTSDTTL